MFCFFGVMGEIKNIVFFFIWCVYRVFGYDYMLF